MSTNFDLAPPPIALPGGLAVPIDIQHIDATVTLNAGSQNAVATATLAFTTGPMAGQPIFDLRQTITGLTLDGSPLLATDAPPRNLGGGAGADMRVLGATLAPNTAHILQIDYALGLPQSPPGGSYPPRLEYLAGPSVRWSFGFTDLVAARYLESWVPANLIFDQYTIRLVIEVTGTAVPHEVVTNGAVTVLDPNRWQLDFPERTTALSPMLELRAAAGLQKASAAVFLPGTGSCTIDAWKPTGGSADLATELGRLQTWLAQNVAEIGPYQHGQRFVAYLDTGGMEYDGGTTSSPGALGHESHHSWWGRAVKPASQADGWIDEAWTTYHDGGSTGTTPLDFTDPPVTLCDRNPWRRATPTASYASGNDLFEGIAATMGDAALRTAMAKFYTGHLSRPTTTAALEEHLVAVSGQPLVVEAFHRFVYGFGDPSPAPDLWLCDDPSHIGANAWGGRFWASPDLWNRHADDGGTTHQDPEQGQDNWFHARVRNRGATARHFVVTFNVKPYAGVEFVYPTDWLPASAAVAGFDLGPGQEKIVRARWPRSLVPAAGTHVCWLAAVLTRGDEPASGAHTWEHNNLAQKNLTVVNPVTHTPR